MFSCHYSINVKRHCDKSNSSKRKHLIGSLIKLSDAWSCIIMAESMISHKCGAGEEAEIHKLNHRQRVKGWTWHGLLKLQSLPTVTHVFPTRPHPFQYCHISQSFSNSAIHSWLGIQICESMAGVLFQTTAHIASIISTIEFTYWVLNSSWIAVLMFPLNYFCAYYFLLEICCFFHLFENNFNCFVGFFSNDYFKIFLEQVSHLCFVCIPGYCLILWWNSPGSCYYKWFLNFYLFKRFLFILQPTTLPPPSPIPHSTFPLPNAPFTPQKE